MAQAQTQPATQAETQPATEAETQPRHGSEPTLRALVIHPDDNVSNLIGAGQRGRLVRSVVEGAGTAESVELVDDIPANHKFARRDIAAGEPVIKYGLSIGTASKRIGCGAHVHAHNIDSNRGRGDLPQ